jgi:hypothetical protein
MAGKIAILGWGSLLWTGDFTTPDEENRHREFDRLHAEIWGAKLPPKARASSA